jgi:hypothetical protein
MTTTFGMLSQQRARANARLVVSPLMLALTTRAWIFAPPAFQQRQPVPSSAILGAQGVAKDQDGPVRGGCRRQRITAS